MMYGPAFFRVHKTLASDKEYKDIFIMGSLDETLYALLQCNDVVNTHKAEVLSISSFFNDRMSIMSKDMKFPGNCDRFFAIILLLLQNTLCCERINHTLLRSILIPYDLSVDASVSKRPLATYDKCVEVALYVCLNSGDDDVKTLSSTMLVYLCESLILLLRMSRSDGSSSEDPPTLRHTILLQKLLAPDIQFDSEYLKKKGVAFLKGLVKSCLRVGMALDEFRAEDVRLSCLKLVITVVNLMQDDSSSLHCVGALLSPSIASQTFVMVTSHSKFDALMISQKFFKVQLRVLRILLACLTSNEILQFDRGIWASLLTSFHAGIQEKDFLLRLVLMKYSQVAANVRAFVAELNCLLPIAYKMRSLLSQNFQEIFADQLCWGETACRDPLQYTWEWLLESIEVNRICATIESFPADDRLAPKSTADDRLAPKSMDDAVDVYQQLSPWERTRQKRNDHMPYSPGFLLPLILGALKDEASAPKARTVFTSSAAHTSIRKQERLTAQRFCEKGALALALASLSCKCPSLRKISLGILSLLTDAVNRPDAHLSASWKERPQVSMLLNSVHRAFVLRFCDYPSGEGARLLDVPELPCFSALFLARASLILLHPGDPLFAAMNRAFLRSEDDAGGFQDLTRLPVFVSLFCSSADTLNQLAAERKFAITLVKDGFMDGSSYKLLVQCHCVELLMTTIECALMRPSAGSMDELLLLLSTLTKIVVLGGQSTSFHLLNQLGLVSWICALILCSPTLANEQTQLSLYTLLLEALKLARASETLISKEDFVVTTSGVAQAVISASLYWQSDERCVDRKVSSEMIALACELLTFLWRDPSCVDVTFDATTTNNFMRHSQSDGIRLLSAIQFLSGIRQSSQHLEAALFAVSCLPLRCDALNTDLVGHFCEQVFESFTYFTNDNDELRFVVLHRISFLSKYMEESDHKKMDIVRHLLTWRSDCSRSITLQRMWYSCLLGLAIPEERECDDFDTCLCKETSLSAWVLRNSSERTVSSLTADLD
jgi:Nucleolar pre-ribosomal-associated protein 1